MLLAVFFQSILVLISVTYIVPDDRNGRRRLQTDIQEAMTLNSINSDVFRLSTHSQSILDVFATDDAFPRRRALWTFLFMRQHCSARPVVDVLSMKARS